MKDDKPKKFVTKEDIVPDWTPDLAVAVPEPAKEEPAPVGTHSDNVKKDRRPGKPQ